MRRRLHPRLGVNYDGAAALLLGDENAVEADVENADAVWEAADVERDTAFVAVLARNLDEQASLLAGDHAYFGLARNGDKVARLDDFGYSAGHLTRHFFSVDHCLRHELERGQFLGQSRVRFGVEGKGRAFLAGR